MFTSPCSFSPQRNSWAHRSSATGRCFPSPLLPRLPTCCPTGWQCCWKAPESLCLPTSHPSPLCSMTPDFLHGIPSKSGMTMTMTFIVGYITAMVSQAVLPSTNSLNSLSADYRCGKRYKVCNLPKRKKKKKDVTLGVTQGNQTKNKLMITLC